MPKVAPTLADRLANLEERLNQLEGNTGRVDPTNTDYDHGGLTGLTDDDHTQYVLEDAGAMLADPTAALGVATKQYVDRLSLLLPLLLVPDLRGLWLMGGDWISGTAVYDKTRQERDLTIVGTLESGLQNNLVPYLTFDGTNDELTRATEPGLVITTALGFMAWLRPHDLSATNGILNKWGSGTNTRGYLVDIQTDGTVRFRISSDGAAGTIKTVTTVDTVTANAWCCIQCYFVPSTGIYIRLNGGSWVANTTDIPATIFNSNRTFYLASTDETSANRLDGDFASAWIANSSVGQTAFGTMYNAQASLFA